MKFVLAEDYTYWWPVTVHIPDPDKPGNTLSQNFEARFKAVPSERLRELEKSEVGGSKAESIEALIREALIDWRDVEAEGGDDIPFSPDALTGALRFSFFQVGVFAALIESAQGGAAQKN